MILIITEKNARIYQWREIIAYDQILQVDLNTVRTQEFESENFNTKERNL